MANDQLRLFPKPLPAVILHYWRHYRAFTEEFGTVDAAVRWACHMQDEGQIAYDYLEFADGTRMEHDELKRRVYEVWD